MKTSFRKKLFTTSMLVAPAILILGSVQPARADCTVVVGGGTVASPTNGSIINCKTFGGDQTATVGDGTDGVHASVNLFDNAVVNVSTNDPVINIDNVTVTLGANAQIIGSYYTSSGPLPKYNTPILSSVAGTGSSSVHVTLAGDNSHVLGGKYSPNVINSQATGSGNASTLVTLSGGRSAVAGGKYSGVSTSANSGNANSVVTLSGSNSGVTSKYSGVATRSTSGNASTVVTLSGGNSQVTGKYNGIATVGADSAYSRVTISGYGAYVGSTNGGIGSAGIKTVAGGGVGQGATSIVTLSGSGNSVYADTGDGIQVSGGDAQAIVTISSGSAVSGSANGIHVTANQAGASGSIIDSAGLIQSTGVGNSVLLDDGNDILNLRTGSDLQGNAADMGGGNDTVNLFGTNSEDENFLNVETVNMNGHAWTFSGISTFTNINVNSGTFSDDGSLAGAVTIANGATFAGTGLIVGAIANSGVVAPGDGGIGTLTQTGNFTQNANGRLNIQFGPATIDLLDITGAADLDGTVAFSQSITGVTNGTTLTFLQTSVGTNGAFTNVIHPIFIDTVLTYGQGTVDVTFNRLSLTTAAQTDSEFAIAQDLDAVIAGGGPNGTAIDTIVNSFTTVDQASDFFASQSGAVQDGLTTSGLDNMELGSDAAMGRIGGAGGSDFAMLDGADGYVTGMNAGDPFAGRSRAVWGKVTGGWGSVDGDSNARGFDYNAGGAAVGGEVYLDRNVTAGIFGAFSSSHASPDGLSDEARTKTYQLGLYAGRKDGRWSYGGTISGAWMDFDTERPTALGDATADFDGSGWFSEVNVAYGVPHSGWTFGPVGGLEFGSVHHESYAESGAGILNLSVDSDTTDNFKSLVGVQAYRSFVMDKGKYSGSFVLDPSFTIQWAHEFLDRSSDTNVAFSSIPTVSFETSGPEKSRDAARIRAELLGHPVSRDKLRLYVAYDGNLASDYQDHRGTIGVKIKW